MPASCTHAHTRVQSHTCMCKIHTRVYTYVDTKLHFSEWDGLWSQPTGFHILARPLPSGSGLGLSSLPFLDENRVRY